VDSRSQVFLFYTTV